MFCYQCEQTAKSVACTVKGVCGKDDEVASLQDALVYALKGLALVAEKAAPAGLVPSDTYPFLAHGMFVTLTNVNFDPRSHQGLDRRSREQARDALKADLLKKDPGATFPEGPVDLRPRRHGRGDSPSKAGSTASTPKPPRTSTSAPCSTPSSTASKASRPMRSTPPSWATATRKSTATSSRPLLNLSRFDEGDLNAWIAKALRCRRDQLQDHGAARQGQHRDLRDSCAHRGAAGRQGRQGHPRLGP